MLVSCRIVPSAFGRGIVIPLVKNTDGNIADSSNYRGIDLRPIISKIFECLIMDMVKGKLISSDLQFGFIMGLYRMRNAVNSLFNLIPICLLSCVKILSKLQLTYILFIRVFL